MRRNVRARGQNGRMALRVEVNPGMITWARERAGLEPEDLVARFPKAQEWEAGLLSPTLKQLENLARATHTSIGFLFLDEPPEESIPIPDFRTMADTGVTRPSPDLLDTIFQCQQRQEWYRSFAEADRADALSIVGSLSTATPVAEAAATMRRQLGFDFNQRGNTFSDAFRLLAEEAEEHGVLVMVNGVVGSNTHRKLDPREFRGFALIEPLAPLVFVNGADTKAAQIFTLAHELAHVWLGQTALSDADLGTRPTQDTERWCNQVAAEFLVPIYAVHDAYRPDADLTEELDRLAKLFKVSTLVVLRRLFDAANMTWASYRTAYGAELDRVLGFLEARADGTSGGSFYNTQPVRVSKRFARALITSTLEGRTLYTEAFEMLGFRKQSTFNELATRLGVG